MKAGLRAFLSLDWTNGRTRQVVVVFFVLLLLGASRVGEAIFQQYQQKNQASVVEEKSVQHLTIAAREFVGLQRSSRRIASDVAVNTRVLDFLSGRSNDRTPSFEVLAAMCRDQDIGIELYNRDADLVAWGGLSGPPHRSEVRIALDGQLTSQVSRTLNSSQLFVAIPIRQEGAIVGVVLIRRTVELNYPLTNRYLTPEGLTDQLARDQGVFVEYNFTGDGEVRKDPRYSSAPLYGIDSVRVGVVSVLRPSWAGIQERISATFHSINAVLLLVLLGVAATGLAGWAFRLRHLLPRLLIITAAIWLTRYCLLWLGIPTAFVSSGIFDPSSFASKFGSGLAKSAGEMTLTVFALGINVYLILRILYRDGGPVLEWLRRRGVLLRWATGAAVTLLLFWLLRGYAATIVSAVFDSTLTYDDARRFFPSFELVVMVLNLVVISGWMVAVSIGTAWFLSELLLPRSGGRERTTVAAVTVLMVFGGVLFTMIQETPLVSIWYATAYALVVVWAATAMRHRSQRGERVPTRSDVLVAVALSALLMYPVLEESIHDKNQRRVETMAEEVLRPVDNWLKFVVDEALQSFQSPTTAEILTGDDSTDIQTLAFTVWSQSSACREGYASAFVVDDSSGREISRFTIGSQAGLASQVDTASIVTHKTIKVKEIGNGVNAVKVYAGGVPILDSLGRILAYGHVILTAGQQTLFRGENPPILRAASQEDQESFYRQVTVAEFRSGLLVTSSSNALPIGYTLPDSVRAQFADPATMRLWSRERIDGISFETYYARRGDAGDIVTALYMPDLGLVHHFVILVRIIVYYFIALIVGLVLTLAYDRLRSGRKSLAFRDRLLIAFLVTAIVPLALIILYGRYTARGRITDNMSQRLQEETSAVVAYVKEQMEVRGQEEGFPVRTASAEAIAAFLGSDFNLFVGNELFVSTRPELYDIGAIDPRMNGSAFAAIYLRGRRFDFEAENIGQFQYAVGYRPVLDNAGVIVGVVSVPTLYRQGDLEEEIFRRNSFLFGIYSIVLLLIVIIATTFANRIAAPLHRLTEATKRVSRGDLEAGPAIRTTDSEIGELVRSFEVMTKDLRKNREELVRYERELAWKEMAKQVAHEIKNPLTPMKLAVQHLRQTYRDGVANFDEVLESVTRTILEQIDTLSRIASEFSHFARMPKRRLEPCDINTILSESLQLFGQHDGLQTEMDAAPDLPPVSADREELRRAFINIIRNGVQAMNGTGRLLIRTWNSEGGVAVSIRDFGSGVPEEMKARLFEPNFSTKTDGMGLGLAIVKKTIDDLFGTISISSTTGEGTTVTIVLPVQGRQA